MEIDIQKQVAEHVARARTELKDAQAQHQEARKRVDNLKGRIGGLEAERGQIIAERAGNDECVPDDKLGHRLALIVADLEGLRPLLAEAEKEAAALNPGPQQERLQLAEKQWRAHQDQVTFDALTQQYRKTEQRLIDLVAEMHATGRKIGRMTLAQNWQPSHDFHRLFNHRVLPGGSENG